MIFLNGVHHRQQSSTARAELKEGRAGDAFRFLDRKFSDRLDAAVASSEEAKKALEIARETYRPPDPTDEEDEGGFSYSFL
jgi:hypothetical protein